MMLRNHEVRILEKIRKFLYETLVYNLKITPEDDVKVNF